MFKLIIMERVKIKTTTGESEVLCDEKFENIGKYLPDTSVFIITDKNVETHYKKRFPEYPVYSVKPGEKSKTVQVAADICKWLLEMGADRKSFLLGIGGGVVCDIAGFAASVFMRGIDFGFVATSLLAQVDASVGGKNGVNLDGYKNIVGTFNQPKFVLCDANMLKTLPKEEFINGFAEIVKHALIADADMFDYIVKNADEMRSCNKKVLEYLVLKSVKIKAEIVMADEREKNVRRKLNLGHTWGHAIEKVAGISHGKAVSIGLAYAALVSLEKQLLSKKDLDRIVSLLKTLELPISFREYTSEATIIFNAMIKDKKKTDDSIDFVLMKGIGSVVVEKIQINELKNY